MPKVTKSLGYELDMSCKIDPALHKNAKPEWIKVRLPSDPVFWSTKGLIDDLRLTTVCEEANALTDGSVGVGVLLHL